MKIPIHNEGYRILLVTIIILIVINIIALSLILSLVGSIILVFASVLAILFLLRFFRIPPEVSDHADNTVYAPAYGTVVALEETTEKEYFQDKRVQISIFMSVWDIHINWYPLSGIVKYFKYHPGAFLIARNPKSSLENERTTVVIAHPSGKEIMLRQIAGAVARRVVCHAKTGAKVSVGNEIGFIKFGSRVDVLLPPGTKVKVKLGQKIKGNVTEIALLKKD